MERPEAWLSSTYTGGGGPAGRRRRATKNHAAPMSAMLAKAPMTMPAIALPEIDDEPPELARTVVLDEDEPGADAEAANEAKELRTDVKGATIPKNVCASVSTPMSPAQQSWLVPQHHFVEFAVPSHGVIRTLLLAYYTLISLIVRKHDSCTYAVGQADTQTSAILPPIDRALLTPVPCRHRTVLIFSPGQLA